MANEFTAMVENLNLEGQVILTGYLENPYLYMSKCQCLLVPADQKENAMNLLEAKAVGLQLVRVEKENPVREMKAFIEGKTEKDIFDPQAYNQKVLEHFERLLG